MRRSAATLILALSVALIPNAAVAESGTVRDPDTSVPNITKARFTNAPTKIRVELFYTDVTEANAALGFDVQWKSDAKYSVVKVIGKPAKLSFNTPTSEKSVACEGLRWVRDKAADTDTFVVPRTCIPKAPNRVKFSAIAYNKTSALFNDTVGPSGFFARG